MRVPWKDTWPTAPVIFEVLQEEQQLFPAENSLVQIQLNQRLALIQLYTALGGSFGSTNNIASR